MDGKLHIDFKNLKTQSMIFVVLVTLLFLFGYFKFLLIPQISRITDTLNTLGLKRVELRDSEFDITRTEEFTRKIKAHEEKISSYEKMLPAEQEIPALLENLSNMAKNSNIKIIGITPVSKQFFKETLAQGSSQIYQEIPILISAKSGYHELGQFIDNLENADRFMKVVDIEMRSNRTTPRKHDVELIVCTYILLKGSR